MKKLSRNLFLFILCLSSRVAVAHEGCYFNPMSRPVCAPPNGGILQDKRGEPVCGKGQCLNDKFGRIVCSSQAGGFAAKDSRGEVVCTEGCEPASAALCQIPR